MYKTGSSVVVEIRRISACTGECKDCAGCETTKLQIPVQSDMEVSAGDRVRVVSEDRAVLFGMFVLFILPLILPVAIYLLTASSGFGIWLGFGTLAVVIIFIWRLSRSPWYLRRTQPQIVEVMSNKKGIKE